jgi:hypothetical protein
MAEIIDAEYARVCQATSDINEHLPTLKRYAAECSSVAEFGVRSVVSTWAMLSGLKESVDDAPKTMICVDIDNVPLAGVVQVAGRVGINLSFQQVNSVAADLGEGVDLLFIDTWHVYGHLRRELAAHCAKVRRYIAMHDTTVDAEQGESIRGREDLNAVMARSGYSYVDVSTGLRPAITEFLATHPEWAIDAVYENNNGLTILRRV